jgi:cytochrome c-type biogenesis protein CcmH/NrfF
MKNRTILLLLTVLLSITTFAQTQNNETESKQATKFKFQRNIQLEDCKENEEIIISIAKNTKEFKLLINTSVSEGKVTVEIYDSNKKKQGTFSVGNQLNIQNSEIATGTINKALIEPQDGDWKVKIISTKAKGIIIINTLSLL